MVALVAVAAVVAVAALPLMLVEQLSTAPEASTPSGKLLAAQLAPLAARAVAVPALPVMAMGQVPVALVPSVKATSLYAEYAVAEPQACCHRRIPMASLRTITRLSLPPEASV